MGEFIEDLGYRIKSTSGSIFLFIFKLFVGFALGLTFALIGQQMIGYGDISFLLMIVTTLALFLRISKSWKTSVVMVFTLICVLIGLLLRMYILVAPGA